MRTMSLYESKESNGSVSLKDFKGMKRLDNILVVMALLCSILLTACTDANIDNPSVAPEDKPEVKPIENDMMDTSVKPGDDFFRYCNGKWIDALTVDLGAEKPDKQYYGFFPTEIQKTYDKNLSELEYPSLGVIPAFRLVSRRQSQNRLAKRLKKNLSPIMVPQASIIIVTMSSR